MKIKMAMAAILVIGGLFSWNVCAQAADETAEMNKMATHWKACGWGGGAFYLAAAWHPTDENVIYMGGDCSGAYRTGNKGLLWQFANNGICNYSVLCLAVSPAAPDLVYALTDGGLCKSVDRARTWEFLAETAPGKLEICSLKCSTVRAVAIDPKNSEIVYAGSRTGKLFKSENGGKNWKELPYRDALPKQEKQGVEITPPCEVFFGYVAHGDAVTSVAVAPSAPAIVFVSNTKHGVFRSDDAGATWTVLNTPQRVLGVTINPDDANIVWAACAESGIYRSADRGKTWSAMNGAIKMSGENNLKLQIVEIALPPGKPDLVYAIGLINWAGSFYRSDDGGKTWTMSNMLRVGAPGDPTFNNENPKEFAHLSTPPNIAVNPKNSDEIFLSANWRNAFSADGGKTWEERSTGADNTCTTDIQFRGNKTYATAMDEGLMVSENGGGEWRQLAPLKLDQFSGHFWRVRVAKAGEAVRIVTTNSPWNPQFANRVRFSADDGKTWNRCAGQPGCRRMFYGLAVDPVDSKRIFWSCCSTGGGVWRSEDEGATWEHVYTNEHWCSNLNLEVMPSGAVLVGGHDLYRSEDHGKTWQQLTHFPQQGDPDEVILGIAFDPANEQRFWISRITWGGGTSGGIYSTLDGGKTWVEITGDIPCRKPGLLRYNPETHELWAGGGGFFKLKI